MQEASDTARQGLLSGFTIRVDLSRPPLNVIMKQVDAWNGFVLAGKLGDWLNAQANEDVGVHLAFHDRREAIDAKDRITKVICSNLPKRNHALVLNVCATHRVEIMPQRQNVSDGSLHRKVKLTQRRCVSSTKGFMRSSYMIILKTTR